jgi:hypothetical protein
MRRCSYPGDSEASQRDLATCAFFPASPEEVIVNAYVFERVLPKERFISIGESRALTPQLLQLAMRNNHGDRFSPSSQFDFDSGLGFIYDSGQIGTSLRDGILFRHIE